MLVYDKYFTWSFAIAFLQRLYDPYAHLGLMLHGWAYFCISAFVIPALF